MDNTEVTMKAFSIQPLLYSNGCNTDVYESAQKIGKYKTIPRTEGVSTTEIVGRMLLMQKSHLDLASVDSEYGFKINKKKGT
jgi:hypothetical protein